MRAAPAPRPGGTASWMAKLSPAAQEAVRRNVAAAPELTADAAQRITALLMAGGA
jgi:hypothetical protein